MRDPARFLLAHTPSPHPAPTLTFWCCRGDCQVEEGLVRVHWRRRDPFHHLLGDQALRAPPVPQLRSQKWSAAWERPNPISTGTSPAALSPVTAPCSRRAGAYWIPTPHTLNPPRFPSTPSDAEERPAFPYVTKRDKHMPWTLKGGSRCDLFDYACGEKERLAKAACAE